MNRGKRSYTRKQMIQIRKDTALSLIKLNRVKEAVSYIRMSLEEFARTTGRLIKDK